MLFRHSSHYISVLAVSVLAFTSNLAQEAPPFSLAFSVGQATVEGNGVAADADGNIFVTGQYQGEARIGSVTLPGMGAQDYFLASFTSSGQPRWAVGGGTTASDYGTSVKLATNGDLIVSASLTTPIILHGTEIIGHGQRDAILARYSGQGQLIWARAIGGSAHDEADDIAFDAAGNILLAGRINGVVTIGASTIGTEGRVRNFLAKFDSTGNPIWAQAVTERTVATGSAVTTDPSGNIYLAAEDIISGTGHILAAKFAPNGDPVWRRTHSANSSGSATGVAIDSTGNVYICGTFGAASITFGSTTLDNPNFALRGFLVKYSPDGNPLWAQRIGGRAYRVAAKADGTTFASGFFVGTSGNFNTVTLTAIGQQDAFITSHTPDGNLAWVKQAGSTSREILRSVALDPVGNVYVAGEGQPTAFGQPAFSFTGSVVVARLNTATQPQGPSMTLVRSGDQLILSWPASYSGYTVETTPDLNQIFQTGTVVLTPVPDQTNTYRLPLPANNLFLRLTKPE